MNSKIIYILIISYLVLALSCPQGYYQYNFTTSQGTIQGNLFIYKAKTK